MMKKILVLLIPFLVSIFQAPMLIGGEIIKGKACYRFSDQESIAAARDIALAMAKREALEGYSVFVNATTTVENYTMKNNLITSITAANLNNLKITKKSENLAKREVCRAIQAEVDPIEIKEQVYKRVSMPNMASGKINTNFPTGLWENKYVKWLKAVKGVCGREERPCFKIRYLCKKRKIINKTYWSNSKRKYKITCTDDEGIPTLIDSEDIATPCFEDDLKVGKIKDYTLKLKAEDLCRSYGHDAAEGSTKMSFEWLN
jgi:hypothetical protein